MFVLRFAMRVSSHRFRLGACIVFLAASAYVFAQSPQPSCVKCHSDIVKRFAGSAHGASSAAHPSGMACESCHGDGKAHADNDGDVSLILNPAKLPFKQVNERCLACHSGQHSGFAQSLHAVSGIACTSCHAIHAGKEGKLLKSPQPALCYQCHADVKTQFSSPVHHKVDEGTMACTACHNPHGAAEERLQAAIAQQVTSCVACHTDKGGVYKYEHLAVKQTGCTSCHAPHGSSNPKLLAVARVNTLCLQCHMPPATVSDAQVNAAHTPASKRPCTDCHSAIHGSNHDQYFARP